MPYLNDFWPNQAAHTAHMRAHWSMGILVKH